MIEPQDRAAFTEQLQARRRGRRRCAVPRQWMSVHLPQDVYDALCQRATRERIPLHALVVRELSQRADVRPAC